MRPPRLWPDRRRRLGLRSPLIGLGLVLALALGTGVAGARPAGQAQSPAAGHAQVIAQGVAPLPSVPVAWRVVWLEARPAAAAPVAERSLGFVVADAGAVVVTADGTGDQVRLAPGEALFVPQGARQQRAAAGAAGVGYYALELVVAPDVAAGYSLGQATLLYASEPFVAPAGRRDLDLVRDVLAPGEVSRVGGGEGPTLILATAGLLGVHAADGGSGSLRPGEAISLWGAVDLSNPGGGEAAYVAAVIGPAVGSAGAAAVAPQPAATGTIAVTPYACPLGMRPETFDPFACPPDPGVIDLQTFVLGSGANLRTLGDARFAAGEYVWAGLPFGDYLVQATGFAPGYDRFLVPGLDGINSPPELGYTAGPNEGYVVPLTAAAPTYRLGVFAFPAPGVAGVADLGLWLWVCPPGVVAAPDLRDAGCQLIEPLGSGFDLAISSAALPEPLTLEDTLPGDAGARLWPDVRFGSYALSATLPPGFDGYAVRSYRADFPIRLLTDGTGYFFSIGAELFDPADDYWRVNLDVYLLR